MSADAGSIPEQIPAPLAHRVAVVILATYALWMTWVEIREIGHPPMEVLEVVLRAARIVVLCVLIPGLWRSSRRARKWAIGLLAAMIGCYLLMAAIVRHLAPESWDPRAWFFSPYALWYASFNLLPLLLLLWPAGQRREGRS